MASMEPARLRCPGCGQELLLPVRAVPAADTDTMTARFTLTVSTEPAERHLTWCPGRPEHHLA